MATLGITFEPTMAVFTFIMEYRGGTGALNQRITHDPGVMGGRPCIRGLRVTVGTIVGLLASGHDEARILELYPYLERDDITAALAYEQTTGGY